MGADVPGLSTALQGRITGRARGRMLPPPALRTQHQEKEPEQKGDPEFPSTCNPGERWKGHGSKNVRRVHATFYKQCRTRMRRPARPARCCRGPSAPPLQAQPAPRGCSPGGGLPVRARHGPGHGEGTKHKEGPPIPPKGSTWPPSWTEAHKSEARGSLKSEENN